VTIQRAKPLPECKGPECGLPVRRETYLANGGLCTDCRLRVDYCTPAQLELVVLPDLEED
jgi:hypothetical protein